MPAYIEKKGRAGREACLQAEIMFNADELISQSLTMPTERISYRAKRFRYALYRTCKRIFDVTASVLALSVFLLPMIIISIIIRITTGKPVIYKHKRVGKCGKNIYIYKFKSMIDTDKPLEKIFNEEQLEQYRTMFKVHNDPRITKFGGILRKTSLDELPQLLNIIKGDMSIVGPRPITSAEVEFYGANKKLLLSVTPGLTGYWQVNGRNAVSLEDRISLELYYAKNQSAVLDLKIIFKTVLVVLKRTGAM